MADAAYDADHFQAAIAQAGARAMVPDNSSRTQKLPFDKNLYKERHLFECCFSKLKHFRLCRHPRRENHLQLPRRRHYRRPILWLR
jgi:transposase